MKKVFSKLERLLPVLLILLFVVLALAADRTPAKKILFSTETKAVWTFFRFDSVDLRSPLPDAVVAYPWQSIPYMLLLRTVHSLVPDRLAASRLTSIISASAGLVLIYLIARMLTSRLAAIAALFFLVTGSAYVETARAFGYVSFSHAAALLAVFFAVTAEVRGGRWLWVSLSAASSYLLLHVYAPMRITAIPLIGLIYLTSGRDRWRRLLLFTGVFLVLVVGVGLLQRGGPGLILRIFQFGRWDEYIGDETRPFIASQLVKHLREHIPVVLGYLFNLKRVVFTTQWTPGAEYSRLYHSAYIPFWVIGLAVCLFRRRRGDVIVLMMLGTLILSRMASHGIWPRRIVDILYPLALLVGIGVTAAYSWLARFSAGRTRGVLAPVLIGGYLLAAGLGEVRHFLLEISPPPRAVSAETLSEIGDFLAARLERNHMVTFPYYCHPYVTGNRYLVNRLQEEQIVRSVNLTGPEGIAPSLSEMLTRYMAASILTGKPLTFIHCTPIAEDFREGIDWARRNFPGAVTVFEIAGGDFEVLTFAPPPGLSPNLIASERPGIRLSGGPEPRPRPFPKEQINFDYWRRASFDVEIRPDRAGGATWMVLDFGEGNRRVPRALLAAPPGDNITVRPALFLRQAVISASSDGREWEVLGRMGGDRVDHRPGRSYRWPVPGDRPFRYYCLEFFDDEGKPAESVRLVNLWLLESENRHLEELYGTRVIDLGD